MRKLTFAICIREEVPSCMRAPPERHYNMEDTTPNYSISRSLKYHASLLFTNLNANWKVQLQSKLKSTSNLLSLCATQRSSKERKVVSDPHQFLLEDRSSSGFDAYDHALHLHCSQYFSFRDGVVQLILIK